MNKVMTFIVLAFISQAVMGASSLYVQSARAKIMEQPSFKAKVLQSLDKGAAVEVVETQGNWIKVKYQEHTGWMAKLLLARQAPQAKPSLLQGQEQTLKESARRRASENATAAATRGLRSEDRTRMSDENHADYQALEKVEAQQVSDEATWKFHDEGLQKAAEKH